MPNIPILPPDKAPKEVNAVYEEFYRRMSFPSAPNFITTQGHSSTVVRGSWEAVRNVLVTGVPEIMEIIAMSAFAVYANIIADATAMEADPMFNTL